MTQRAFVSALAALTALIIVPAQAWAFEWQIFHVATGAKPALDIQPSNEFPHISFMTEDQPGFVKHAEWNGGGFDITTVVEGYFYGPPDLVVIESTETINNREELFEVPHIVFHDHQGDTFDPSRGDQIHASQPSPFAPFWVARAIEHAGHDGWDNSVAAFDERIHTASIDPDRFGSASGVEYYATPEDEIESIGSGPVDYEFGTSIAMDAEGNPHITWFDYASEIQKSETLQYAIKRDGAWTIETVDDRPGAGRFSSVGIGPSGRPGISYYASEGDEGIVRYAEMDEAGTWRIEEVDRISAVPDGPTGARNLTSLDYAPSGSPVIAYASFHSVRIAVRTAGEWTVETVVSEPEAGRFNGGLTSLRMGTDGTAHIAFYEFDQSLFNAGLGIPTGTVYYARGRASNRQPVRLIGATPAARTIIAAAGETVDFSIELADADGSALTISWTLNGQPVEGETGAALSLPATASPEDVVRVTATDGESTVSHEWTVARSLRGDFDGNNTVDFNDFLTFAPAFGLAVSSGVDPAIDLDGSGTVDFNDFLIFSTFFGVSL